MIKNFECDISVVPHDSTSAFIHLSSHHTYCVLDAVLVTMHREKEGSYRVSLVGASMRKTASSLVNLVLVACKH